MVVTAFLYKSFVLCVYLNFSVQLYDFDYHQKLHYQKKLKCSYEITASLMDIWDMILMFRLHQLTIINVVLSENQFWGKLKMSLEQLWGGGKNDVIFLYLQQSRHAVSWLQKQVMPPLKLAAKDFFLYLYSVWH